MSGGGNSGNSVSSPSLGSISNSGESRGSAIQSSDSIFMSGGGNSGNSVSSPSLSSISNSGSDKSRLASLISILLFLPKQKLHVLLQFICIYSKLLLLDSQYPEFLYS